jgi:hypothetical protein
MPDQATEHPAVSALKVLLTVANRQSHPGITTTSKLDQLEVTLRFQKGDLDPATLKQLASIAGSASA